MTTHQSGVPRMLRIDKLCDQFEQEWIEGRRPALATFLREIVAKERSDLFRALLRVELELRQNEQPPPDRTDYLRRFPTFHQEILETFAGETSPEARDLKDVGGESASSTESVVMEVISGPHKGKQFAFSEHDTFLVGRSSKAHLRLAKDPHFSRFHFRLEVNPPVCYLIDLGSRNGTFVNGKPVRECHIHDGDVISGGSTELKIVTDPIQKTVMMPGKSAAEKGAKPQNELVPPSTPWRLGDAQKSPEPGSVVTIPGYQIHEEIGRGDLGTTYRAERLATGETVALKVMTPASDAIEKSLQLFLRECTVLSQLTHPHIVKLHDQGVASNCLYLATEFVPTIPMSEVLQQQPLTSRIKIFGGLISQILNALQFAHARSLIHRDIKPGNVLVAREGRKLTAKLADFGVAKHYTNAGFSQITRAGDVIGSLPFMPMEQFLNSREARPSCDLYAVGATLYHWLTNHTPHDFPTGRSQFLVVLEDSPVPISKRLPEIPPAIAAFVDRSLSRKPEQRFASAEEMRYSLNAVLR